MAMRDAAITIGPFKPSRPGYGPVLSYLQAAQLETPLRIHPLLNIRTWDPKPYAKYLAWNCIEHPMFAAIWVDYDDTETEWIKERGQPATSPIVEELNLGHVETGWSVRVRNRMGITCEDVLFAIYDFFASPLYVDELGEMHPRAVRIMEQQYFEKRRMGFFDLMEGYRKSDALVRRSLVHSVRLLLLLPLCPFLLLLPSHNHHFQGNRRAGRPRAADSERVETRQRNPARQTPQRRRLHKPDKELTRQLGMTYFDGIHNDPESVARLKAKYNFHSANLLLLRLGSC